MSASRFAIACLLVGFTVAPSIAQTIPGQTFVYMSDSKPVLIRFHLTIDGKPLQQAWDDCMAFVFRKADRNRDGSLDRNEAKGVVAASLVFGNFGRAIAFPEFEDLDADHNGSVSPDELADYYAKNGGHRFRYAYSPAGNPWSAGYIYNQQPTVNSTAINKRFFYLLDMNNNQQLDQRELQNAESIFRKLDANDDAMVDLAEFMPIKIPAQPILFPTSGSFRGRANVTRRNFLLRVDSDMTRRSTAEEIFRRYGNNTKRIFKAKDLSLSNKAFDTLDRDDDGWIDGEELLAFADRDADIEIEIHYGKRFQMRLRRSNKNDGSVQISDDNLSVTFDIGMDRILVGRKPKRNEFNVAFVEQNYLAQLANADRDGNGYLDSLEAARNNSFRNIFTRLDADGDGKLFAKELTTFLKSIRELQEMAAKSSMTMNFRAQGFGLFDVADTRPDGRLGIRELRNLAKLVGKLDKNGDGFLQLAEIPRNYQLTIDKGSNQQGAVLVAFGTGIGMVGDKRPIEPTKGPKWFRNMDVNQDGDVSVGEFLGTAKDFRRIDVDRDGLIDAREAEAATRQSSKR